MTTLTDRLNAIRERAERAWSEGDAEKFPATCSDSQDDVLPLLEAVEDINYHLGLYRQQIESLRGPAERYAGFFQGQLSMLEEVARNIEASFEKRLGGGDNE